MSSKSGPQRIPKSRTKQAPITSTSDEVAPAHIDGIAESEQRRSRVSFDIPRITGVTAAGGGTGLMIAIATGYIQPEVTWPLVTLCVSGMLYDLGRRALGRRG